MKRRKNEYRYDERLETKTEESTYLEYTGFHEELEHLKIKTRLINVNLANVMGEYVNEEEHSLGFRIVTVCLLLIDKARTKQELYMSVGVMKD